MSGPHVPTAQDVRTAWARAGGEDAAFYRWLDDLRAQERRIEAERIAELLHVHRFDHRDGRTAAPDTFYGGMVAAERLACPHLHPGATHGELARGEKLIEEHQDSSDD